MTNFSVPRQDAFTRERSASRRTSYGGVKPSRSSQSQIAARFTSPQTPAGTLTCLLFYHRTQQMVNRMSRRRSGKRLHEQNSRGKARTSRVFCARGAGFMPLQINARGAATNFRRSALPVPMKGAPQAHVRTPLSAAFARTPIGGVL